jgi:SCY1-like protein 2
MDVLNKLRSTVSNTVSQLSGVLPGNPVTREFEATCHIASAGPGLQWKIYRGYKKSTKQEAAIFVFEKRQLERLPRSDRDAMLETLRRGVSQLTRLRHPQILIVQHPLEESRESLAFATEPVFASLANVLGSTENMPSPLPSQLKNYKLFEVEIKYGLLQVGEGLAFLHNDVKLLHHNICPEVIVINQQGAWKIFGFDFCIHSHNTQDSQEPYWPFVEYSPTLHPMAQPCLDYLAPEYALTLSHSPASDMFSLGMLILAVHNSGQPLNNNNGDWNSYKRNACELKQASASRLLCVTDGLREFVKMLLNVTPELRPDAHQFTKIEFFEDVGVKTLNYLDSLFQWDNLQKSQFYKGLPQIIQNLPHRVCIHRILPCLMKEFVNPTMVPFVLPNVLLVTENCSRDEYLQHILPHLKPVMKLQEPIQILLIFMQKMELLLKLTPAEEIKSDVLPMLYRALESEAQQIQELCLSVLPTFAGLIDYPAMKNALLPRIKRLCIATSYISVRVNCLVCVGKLLEHLDKWLVLDEVLPFLPQIPSREPAVLMGILGIYKLALTHKKLGITKELMATKILPFLMPLSIENGLTLNQFNALMALIKEMVSRVEGEHRTKLEQLNSIQQESKSVPMNLTTNPSQLVPAPQPQSDLDQMFSGLGLDDFMGGSGTDATPKTPQVNGNVNYSTSLTLKDKQRLTKQQEAHQRLQTQPILSPSGPAQSKAETQVKDLTATLVESNINQIKYTRPPIQTGDQMGGTGWQNAVRPATSPQGFGAFQTAPVSAQWQWQSPPASFISPQQPLFTSPHQRSSLDSLLPPTAKLPMNRMQTPLQQSFMTMSPFQQSQPQQTKALSSSEINDFLS